MLRTVLIAALALTIVPLAAGLAVAPEPEPLATTHFVRVFNFGFEDATTGSFLTQAAVGDVVRFVFESRHSATSGAASAALPLPGPSSGILGAGATYDFTVTSPGTLVYTCVLHGSMNGVISAS